MDAVTLPAYVRHIQQEDWMNKDIYGIGIEHGKWRYGFYKNTEGKTTAYIGREILTGVTLLAGTGYERAPIVPAVLFSVNIPVTKTLGAQVFLLPNPLDLKASAYGIAFRMELK
jgi:hypothetical protein